MRDVPQNLSATRRRAFGRRALVALLMLCACGPREVTTRLSAEQWREDLRHLARELPRRHANAFHAVSRERFEAEVARTDAELPRLDADQSLVALMRVVALVGDGHTHLDLPPSWPRYPLELHWFGDELRVAAAAAPYHAALGARVRGVGDAPLDEALRRAAELVPRAENDARTRLAATQLLTSPAVLRGLGLARGGEAATFVLETDDGARAATSISPAPPGDFASWRLACGDACPLYLRRLGEPWWAEFLPEAGAVYFSFSRYPPEGEFRERAEALGRLLDETGARRLVIDLRRNEGGDFDRFRRLLVPVIESRPGVGRAGGLYVITGPGTFSAAVVNALDLRQRAGATLVGEPTGMRPAHYGDHGEFRLPRSGFRVSYATRYHRFGPEAETAVHPDRLVRPTWEDFRAGRDPALEWVLAQGAAPGPPR